MERRTERAVTSASIAIVIIALAAVLLWFLGRPSHPGRRISEHAERDQNLDHEVLAEAEQEVRDLDPLASPEEAEEELPDWGPGAQKP